MKILLICRSSRPQSRCSSKFCKIHRKISTPESFIEVLGRRLQAYYFIEKETPAQVEICKILMRTFFIEQMWTTASGYIRILTAKKFQYQSSLLAKVPKRQEEEGDVNYSSLHTSAIKGEL